MSAISLPFAGTASLLLFLAKATLLLVAALIGTATLRRSTAGARHLVWLAALVGVLALPLLSRMLSRIPSLKLDILPSALAPNAAMVSRVFASDAPRSNAPIVVEVSSSADRSSVAPVVSSVQITGVSGGVSGGVAGGVDGALPMVAATGLSLLSMIAFAWVFVALGLVAWLIAGAIAVRRIVGAARELTSPDWTMPLCEVADRLDLDVPPRIVMSDRIEMAFACRALTPTIVLPQSAESWSDARRRAVLFHELAHVKRHDLLGHTLGRLACALYWFHPLVWTAAKQLRAESERACDDLVLTCGARPSEYAQHLLDMVTNVRDQGAPIMALPMARKKEFEGRMLAILDPAIRRASPGRLQAVAVIATLGVLSLSVAAVSPAEATPASADASPQTPASEATVTTPVTPIAPVERSAPPVAPKLASPAPAPSPSPSPSPRQAGQDMRVRTGNHALDGFVNSVTNVVVGSVSSALQKAGAQLARQGRLQSTDTGRVAMMIKILSTDQDASVRRTAAWGLQDADTPEVRAALTKSLRSDADDQVREMAAWALGEQGDAAAGPALGEAMLHDKSAQVRGTAAWALGETSAKSEIAALESAMTDSSAQVRELAIWAVGEMDVQRAPKTLVDGLHDPSRSVRLAAAWALGEIEDKSTAPAIIAAFKTETDGRIRSAEMRTLSVMDALPTEIVEESLKSPDPEVRRRAVGMLAGSHTVEPWPWPRPMPRPMP